VFTKTVTSNRMAFRRPLVWTTPEPPAAQNVWSVVRLERKSVVTTSNQNHSRETVSQAGTDKASVPVYGTLRLAA
jgi:hypothetical protein